MSDVLIIGGWFLILLSGYVLSKFFRMIVQYRQNLKSHGVKRPPFLRAHFVAGGSWSAALLVGILMVVLGWQIKI